VDQTGKLREPDKKTNELANGSKARSLDFIGKNGLVAVGFRDGSVRIYNLKGKDFKYV